MTRIVCAQLAPQIADIVHNHKMILRAITDHPDADLLILPELSTSGYMLTAQEARSCAIKPADSRVAEWASTLRSGQVLALGFAEQGEDGKVFNSAMFVDSSGPRAVYRKVHLWDTELAIFTPGEDTAPVVDFHFGRLGLMVCYDLEFPEYTRTMGLQGVDALAVPTNWPLVERPEGERPPEVVIAQAAARVNRMAIFCCDRSGEERSQKWTEGTSYIGTDGWVRATAINGVLDVDVDLTEGHSKTISPNNDLFKDRKPGVYHLS